jgi:putative holliday junction resolvase
MPTILALDIGTKRTGVAVAYAGTSIAVARDTLHHESGDALIEAVRSECVATGAAHILLGLPLLPSGAEGAQVRIVQRVGAMLQREGYCVLYADERYTTPRNAEYDGNSAAACAILACHIDRES